VIADVPRVKLSELVGRFGTGLSRDARQCKALLADVCANEFRGECAVLVAAVEEGVAGELLSNSSGLPPEVLLSRLSDRLQANRGVSSDLARWGVESWAVALGVVPQGSTLATFKMDALASLIDLAGANGIISDAELDHLILEAKTRSVSEADARAYLFRYAAARGWQLGKPQAASGRARAKVRLQPPPPRPRQPQRQPASPPPIPARAPSSGFRWLAATVITLAAVAVVVVAKVKEQPQPASTTASKNPEPAPDAGQPQQADLADQEQRAFNAAQGNLSALQAYVNTCTVCAFAPAARGEIASLEAAEQEEQVYYAARGNKEALQAYLYSCRTCAYADAARREIAALEAALTNRVASSTVLCGRAINYVIDGTGVPDLYRPFLGVWTGAAWNSRICGGLIVGKVDNDGMASVSYVYGPLSGSDFPWKLQSPTAVIRDNQLTFEDEERGNFTFGLSEQNILKAHFYSASGLELEAVLTRDLSSVPR
jgi:hypothetical protein